MHRGYGAIPHYKSSQQRGAKEIEGRLRLWKRNPSLDPDTTHTIYEF